MPSMKNCVLCSLIVSIASVSAFQSGSSLRTTSSSFLLSGQHSGITSYQKIFISPQTSVEIIHSRQLILHANPPGEKGDQANTRTFISIALQNPLVPATIAFFYWYLLVFGAAAAANGFPVPSFIPMVPGWLPSDQDLAPVIEDSIHFFYISDALDIFSGGSSPTIEQVPQLRLAFFNIAEAYIFSFLPLLLADKKRLPLPVVLGTWFGALGLTNAFLAPYLALRQIFMNRDDDNATYDDDVDKSFDSKVLNFGFGSVASLVVGFALFQTILTTASASGSGEWLDFLNLVKSDRSYLAFAVDFILFTCFQLFLLDELKFQNPDKYAENSDDKKDNIPLIGILAWLFKE